MSKLEKVTDIVTDSFVLGVVVGVLGTLFVMGLMSVLGI